MRPTNRLQTNCLRYNFTPLLSCQRFIRARKQQSIRFQLVLAACVLVCFFLNWRVIGQTGPPSAARINEGGNAFPVTFTDIAVAAGLSSPTIYGGIEQKRYIIETNGCGVAFLDYDNDGWMDVLILSGTRLEPFPDRAKPTNRLYRNNRNGTFTEVTGKAGLKRSGWASSVCVGDYDNDGYDDLFITYWGQNVLYRNNGNGTFTDLTQKAGLSTTLTRWGSGCTFVDYDRDGKLDLFVANYLKFDIANTPEPGKGANCTWKESQSTAVPKDCRPTQICSTTMMATEHLLTCQKVPESQR